MAAGNGGIPQKISFPLSPAATLGGTNGFGSHAPSALGPQTIPEDVMGEHRDIDSDRDQGALDKDINDFLVKAKRDLQRQGHQAMDFKVPRILGASTKRVGVAAGALSPRGATLAAEGAPTMKGNIEPIKRGQQSLAAGFQSDFARRLAEEFDIDNVIEKADQKEEASEINDLDSMASFQLSVNQYNYEINSQSQASNVGAREVAAQTLDENVLNIPGVGQGDGEALITSDSDFDEAAEVAGHGPQGMARTTTAALAAGAGEKATATQKHVSRAFKKMLSLSYSRGTPGEVQRNERSVDGGSTKYEGKSAAQQDFDVNSESFEIESRYKKKKARRRTMSKAYKEDDPEANALQELLAGQTDITHGLGLPGGDARQLEECVSTKRPADPYRAMDPLTQKVEIQKDLAYAGTSQGDVLQQRQVEKEKTALHRTNHFMKLPAGLRAPLADAHEDRQYVKNVWAPHQQKFEYRVQLATTEEEEASPDEDEIQAQEQPYFTATRINYLPQTTQV